MKIPWRIGIQQRVLPVYRSEFFEMLARECTAGLQVFAGSQRKGEGIAEKESLTGALLQKAKNRYIPLGRSHILIQQNILQWLLDWKPECLIVEANPRNISTLSAIRKAKKHGIKVIGWGLGVPEGKLLRRVRKYFWNTYLSNFDSLITYSTAGKQRYSNAGYPPKKIHVAPNAVAKKTKEKITHRPDIFHGPPRILMVGRLIEVKKVDKLLIACSKLPADIQPRITIVGDGPYRSQWMQLAKEVFPGAEFPGDVRGEKLTEYFRQADLFVLPGTGGLAVQQAMSFALPVIVGTADGTQADLVRPGNGWQLADDKLDTLIHTLQVALGDVNKLRKMGAESWRIVQDEVNLENMVEVFTRAIAETMKSK